MSLTRMLEYTKMEKIQNNKVLLEIARKVVNSSPEPRYKIKLRDDVLVMKEKERLGFNFNRSVTASLRSRWDVVEKATADYLQEVIDMNDQIEDDSRKYENQLINLIVTRTTNLGLNSRIEQMAGLFMHMNFYCAVLKFKIQHLEPTRAFIFTCSDLMGFSRPSQLIDRYAALQHVFTELYADYETRQNLLNHLTETLSEVKAETNHRNMLMHNQMAEMHTRIKNYQTESAQLERAILDQMELSTGASLEIYKIKNAVYNIYITMMNYRCMEASETETFAQLDELEVRIMNTQAVVKKLQMDEAKRQSKKKVKKKEATEVSHSVDDLYSESNRSDEDSDNQSGISYGRNTNANISAVGSASIERPGSKLLYEKDRKSSQSSERRRRFQNQVLGASQNKQSRMRLPDVKGSSSSLFQDRNGTQEADMKLPSLDTTWNRSLGRELGGAAKLWRNGTSLTDSRESLPVIRTRISTSNVRYQPTK